MKVFGPLLFLVGLAGAYLFLTGKIPGYGQGTPDIDPGVNPDAAVDAAGQAGESGLSWFLGTAWAPAALVALLAAFAMHRFWQKIGTYGRGFLLIVTAVAVTIFVLGVPH